MGFKVQVDTITNVTNSSGLAVMNANDQELADEFDEVLYRDGSQTMQGELDMDSNRIINLPTAISNSEPVTLGQIGTLLSSNPSTVSEFTATAGQAVFTLSFTPLTAPTVYVNGVRLVSTDYSVSGGTVTLDDPRAVDDSIVIVTSEISPVQISSTGVTFTQTGTGAVVSTSQEKMRQRVSTLDFIPTNLHAAIIDGTSTSDVTTYVQAAINAVITAGRSYELNIIGHNRVTAPLNITAGINITGNGTTPYVGATGTRGGGSWLHFDHLGKGFNITNAAALMSGIKFSNFGTRRSQTAPGGGWTPIAADYDFYINNADVTMEDIMLLNPTKGIELTNGSAGRLTLNRVRGQPLQVGLKVTKALDVVSINQLHFWPFWYDDSNVHTYTKANLDALYFERCDNPNLSNIFTIFARAGLRIGQNADGTVNKIRGVNLDFDVGKYSLWIDSTVTTGVTGQLTNFTAQAETGLADSRTIFIEGNSSNLDITNIRSDRCNKSVLDITGTSNLVGIDGLKAYTYDQAAGGHPAIKAAATNIVRITGSPVFDTGTRYSTTGSIFVDEWRSYTPTITAGTGTLTTVTGTGLYKMYNDTVTYQIRAAITTNGTGSNNIIATLPVAASASAFGFIGAGRETALLGFMVSATVAPSATTALIYKVDNTYPGADGHTIEVSGHYKI